MKKLLFVLAAVVAFGVVAYDRVVTVDKVEKENKYKNKLPDFKDYWEDENGGRTKQTDKDKNKDKEKDKDKVKDQKADKTLKATNQSCNEVAECTTA